MFIEQAACIRVAYGAPHCDMRCNSVPERLNANTAFARKRQWCYAKVFSRVATALNVAFLAYAGAMAAISQRSKQAIRSNRCNEGPPGVWGPIVGSAVIEDVVRGKKSFRAVRAEEAGGEAAC